MCWMQIAILATVLPSGAFHEGESKKSIGLLSGEHWYGAETVLGSVEPFSATNLYKKVDLRSDHGSGIGGN